MDRSGSMAGGRWNRSTAAALSFIRHLTDEDLVCGVVFNDKVDLVLDLIGGLIRTLIRPNNIKPLVMELSSRSNSYYPITNSNQPIRKLLSPFDE